MAFLYRLVQSKFSFELNLYDLMNAERKYSAFGVQNAVSNGGRSLEHEKNCGCMQSSNAVVRYVS